MTLRHLTIPYPDELLPCLKTEPQAFEQEARLLLAVKLYEQGRISTGMAATLAGLERVTFLFELQRFGLSPIGVDPDELASDTAHA
jgi:predicted HTH domain antitoxin